MHLTRVLTTTLTALVLLIAVTAALWSYATSNHELDELFDAELAQSTRIVQGLVRQLANTGSRETFAETMRQALALPSSIIESEEEEEDDEILSDGSGHRYEKKIAFEIWSDTGEPLLSDNVDADHRSPAREGYAWTEGLGYPWRTFTIQDPQTGFWVRTAQRADIRKELSQELAVGNVLPLLILLPLIVVAIIITVQLSFRPLRQLERSARAMNPNRIQSLDPERAPHEVRGLVEALNRLLQSLNAVLERERRFSADASHELRTPLAALRLNLERLATRNPESLNDLLASVDRMGHLVEQLLLLSRVDSDHLDTSDILPFSEIVAQSIADIVPLALKRGIEVEFNDQAANCRIRGNDALLNTLVRSLLANAVQYGPEQSLIEVSLRETADWLELSINDQGPGIPLEARERAMSRFVRLDQRQGTGAGLGLAIAGRIAQRHGGKLELLDREDGRPGLRARVSLPWSPPSQNPLASR